MNCVTKTISKGGLVMKKPTRALALVSLCFASHAEIGGGLNGMVKKFDQADRFTANGNYGEAKP